MACVIETMSNSNQNVEQEDLLVTKIGALLSSCPDVAQTVLRHMTMVELYHSRLVCRLWNTMSTKLLAQRCVPHYTIYHDTVGLKPDGTHRPPHRVCPRVLCRSALQKMSSRPDLCLVFSTVPEITGIQFDGPTCLVDQLDFIREMMPPQSNSLIVCNLGFVGSVERDHESTVNKLSQAVCGLQECKTCSVDTSSSSRFNKKRQNSSSSRSLADSDVPSFFTDEDNNVAADGGGLLGGGGSEQPLPPSQGPVGPLFGVGYSTSVVQQTRRVITRDNFQTFFSMLCLSNNIPDVNFKLFSYLSAAEANSAATPNYDEHVSRIIEEEGPLRALLLFEGVGDPDITEAYTEAYIQAALKRTVGRVAIGGTVNNVCCCTVGSVDGQFRTDPIETYGIAVCGTGVRAASIVLNPNVKTLDHAIRELEKLKVVYDPSKRSLAFMLACRTRNEDWYGERGRRRRHHEPSSLGYALPQAEVTRLQKLPASVNVEVAMIRSLFPNTPVVGTLGNGKYSNGEYCYAYQPRPGAVETVTEEEERELHKLLVRVGAYTYSYSTVVVFLQFDTL